MKSSKQSMLHQHRYPYNGSSSSGSNSNNIDNNYPEPLHKQTTRPIPPQPNVPIITSGPTSRAAEDSMRGDAMVSSPMIAQTKDHMSTGLTTTLDHIVGQVGVIPTTTTTSITTATTSTSTTTTTSTTIITTTLLLVLLLLPLLLLLLLLIDDDAVDDASLITVIS